jgi:TolB-like protein/tetratricopeptide (TPR) repeat protein
MWRVHPLDNCLASGMGWVLYSSTRFTFMERGTRPPFRIRFGIFEADLVAGELLRRGEKVALQQQPFGVLAALLERPGELIARAELQEKMWPGDRFIDAQRGINKAINRLRQALGDSVEKPHFIETLPRRGYRFIAPVERTVSSIAVLPLDDLSGDPNQEYWADGITDELVTQIAKIKAIKVISRTSAMRFKGSAMPLQDVARQLDVDALVQGSLVVSAQRIRIRVQLIDAHTDRHIWTESYERELADVLTLQTEIAQAIAERISSQLVSDCRKVKPIYRVEPDAFEAFLKGRFFWDKRTEPNLKTAIDYFNRAVLLDPQFALARVGLADCHTHLGIIGVVNPHSVIPRAKAAAEAALRIDDTLVEAYSTLGHIRTIYEWDWHGAEQNLTRAIDINPNCASAHQYYGILLGILRRHRDAIEHLKKARALDPLSLPGNALLGFIYMRARQHKFAIEACQCAVELDPNNAFGHWMLSRMLDADEQLGNALVEAETAASLSNGCNPYKAHLGYALARSGNPKGALKVIDELLSLAQAQYVSPYLVATVYVGLGWKDLALEWLERAWDDRSPRLNELNDPLFDELQSDPRFQFLKSRVGFPEGTAAAAARP